MSKISETILGNIFRDTSRPWGSFSRFANNEQCTVKIITVDPGGVLSKQFHKNRDELWVAIDSGLTVQIGEKTWDAAAGEEIVIERGVMHRLSNTGSVAGRILEISFGEFDENDITRVEDVYGRK